MAYPSLALTASFGDLSPYGIEPAFSIQRGTTSPLVTGFVSEAAAFATLLDNISRDLDPSYTAGPFFGDLRQKFNVTASATWDAVEYFLFDGRADNMPVAFPFHGVQQQTDFRATDYLQWLAATPINTSRPAERSGVRIQAVLDAVDYPWATDIDPGMSTVYGQDLQTVAALSHLGDVAQVEYGELRYDPATQVLSFRDRNSIATDTRSTVVQAEYVRTGGLNFVDATVTTLPIINYVALTYGPDGRQITVSDAASITAYDQQAVSISLPFETASQARSYGKWLLLLYAEPRTTITQLLFHPSNEPGATFDLWADLLSRQEGDLVEVTLDPLKLNVNDRPVLSGEPIIVQSWIRGLGFNFDSYPWSVSMTLQPTWVDGLFFWDTSELDGPDYYGL